MSPSVPEAIVVEFSVEDGLQARWDEPRIFALVASIVSSDLRLRSDPPLSGGRYVIGLHLVSDATIRALNAEHRGMDVHTDVLSFPLVDTAGHDFVVPTGEPRNLGDVVVSYPRAVEQAADFGHTTERELAYLVAHGVLHVLGYDHEDAAEQRRMRQREEEALEPLGFIR